MFRVPTDQNFNGHITSGLLLRFPDLDLVRAQDVGLSETEDPAVLDWAASENRIVLTHDKRTMPTFANRRVAGGEPMAGVFVVDDLAPIGAVLDDLAAIVGASRQSEWAGAVEYLPFKRSGR
jgi:hypothetical protein